MKKITIAVIAALALSGCASADYKYYKEIQVEIAKAEAERFKAMARIAETGDSTTKVAAMFALQGSGQAPKTQNVAPPKTSGEILLQWAGILLPTAVQAYGIHANQQVSLAQSNNARLTAVSTNEAFTAIAGQIQAPQANITTTTTTSTNNTSTLSGTGVLGTGSYTTSANPTTTTNTTTTTDRHDTTTNDNHSIVNPPGGKVCTTSTAGVLTCQ